MAYLALETVGHFFDLELVHVVRDSEWTQLLPSLKHFGWDISWNQIENRGLQLPELDIVGQWNFPMGHLIYQQAFFSVGKAKGRNVLPIRQEIKQQLKRDWIAIQKHRSVRPKRQWVVAREHNEEV